MSLFSKSLNALRGQRSTPATTSQPDNTPVIVVSGLPRSGTSMMMKALEAGGITMLTDNLRQADVDNPKGYYEFERVKQLPQGDTAWLAEARGKGVKVIAALLEHLPPGYPYRVLFMQRALPEILASQKKMLARRGEDPDKVNDEEMARLFTQHVNKVKAWLAAQPHMAVLDVDYNQMLAAPRPHLVVVNQFLDNILDVDRMVAVVDQDLYRNRAAPG